MNVQPIATPVGPGSRPERHRPAATRTSCALVTASYSDDFERCRLLCETVDRNVSGMSRHYLLVAEHDVALFRQLEGPRRVVIGEGDILPSRLVALRDPTSLFRRHLWLGAGMIPLRGWNVQQLRRIALAAHVGEDVLFYCDSDVAFVRPFNCGDLVDERGTRFFRRDDGCRVAPSRHHSAWIVNAGWVLDLPANPERLHDYIATLVAWRRDAVLAMCGHIEQVHCRNWMKVVSSRRRQSECMLYGRFVDEVLGGKGHVHTDEELCRVMWGGPRPDESQLRGFIETMAPHQVAIGVQSFIGLDPESLRRALAEMDR